MTWWFWGIERTGVDQLNRLWHVTLTVSGNPVNPMTVRDALVRLNEQRPFLHSMRYGRNRAEVQFWEEATSLFDASALALRVWPEHRLSARLPAWEVTGLEVVERSIHSSRGSGFVGSMGLDHVLTVQF